MQKRTKSKMEKQAVAEATPSNRPSRIYATGMTEPPDSTFPADSSSHLRMCVHLI